MTTLFAQPYDISASGFYFDSADQFTAKSIAATNDYGDPVEEFEIQFIDGADIDCELARAWGLNQSNFAAFFDAVDNWDNHQKLSFIIAVGECGFQFDPGRDDPDRFEVDIYHVDSLKELAEQFVDEGLFGEIPSHLRNYLDFDAIARDLACDYASTTIAGNRLAYRCA